MHLQLNNEGIDCPHCHRYSDILHDTSYILVRDLSIFGQLVYLKVPRRKFYCKSCGRYPTEVLSWVEKRRGFTCRYENYIYQQVKQLTVEQVSVQERLSSDQVQRIFSRIAGRELAKKDWGEPQRLSLDEFSRQKGKGKFATVVTDLDKGS